MKLPIAEIVVVLLVGVLSTQVLPLLKYINVGELLEHAQGIHYGVPKNYR